MDRPDGVVGTEHMRRETLRQEQRQCDRGRDHEDDHRRAGVVGTEQHPRNQHEVGPDEGRRRTDRRGHRVHRHHLTPRDHMWQGGR